MIDEFERLKRMGIIDFLHRLNNIAYDYRDSIFINPDKILREALAIHKVALGNFIKVFVFMQNLLMVIDVVYDRERKTIKVSVSARGAYKEHVEKEVGG